jgi:hypothetical protein
MTPELSDVVQSKRFWILVFILFYTIVGIYSAIGIYDMYIK